LVYTSHIKNNNDSINLTDLLWKSLLDDRLYVLWSGKNETKIGGYTFDNIGNQLAFNVQQEGIGTLNNTIWYYKYGMEKAIIKVNKLSPGIPVDLILKNDAALQFSGNGKWLFFTLTKSERVYTIKT
jgi:hypothetical protein